MINSFLSKLNPNAELTPEERTIYAKKLEYITRKTEELELCAKDSQDITESMGSIENKFKQIENIVYQRQQKYQKLMQSIQNLNETIRGFPTVVEKSKETWEKLSKIENLLKESEANTEKQVSPKSPRNRFITKQGSTDSFGSSIDPPQLNTEAPEDISSPLTSEN